MSAEEEAIGQGGRRHAALGHVSNQVGLVRPDAVSHFKVKADVCAPFLVYDAGQLLPSDPIAKKPKFRALDHCTNDLGSKTFLSLSLSLSRPKCIFCHFSQNFFSQSSKMLFCEKKCPLHVMKKNSDSS